MHYTQLTEEYKYDTIASAVYAREVEYFHYDFDRANFQHLVDTLPDGPFRNEIAERLKATLEQMDNVVAIMDALKAQIDDPEAYAKAVERVTEKRKDNDALCSG